MVLTIEYLGFLMTLFCAIAFFLIKGRKGKIVVAACVPIALLGFLAAIAFERGELPFLNHAAPISVSTQVIFSSANMDGQMAIESLNARDGSMRWRHLLNIRNGDYEAVGPVVSGNVIYAVGSDQTHNALVLYALQSQHGDLLWSRVLGSYSQDTVWEGAGPLPMDWNVYIAARHTTSLGPPVDSSTTLYALRANDGVSIWSRQFDSVAYQSIDDWGP